MHNTQNALAELAECIKNADIQIGKMAGCSFECIRKAQLIVEELSKVNWPSEGTERAFANCRAIAEGSK